jgi:hypothetical protein
MTQGHGFKCETWLLVAEIQTRGLVFAKICDGRYVGGDGNYLFS